MRLGHALIRVSDLERSVEFYTRHLDLRVRERVGHSYVLLAGGEGHHELALAEAEGSARGPTADPGLDHLAFESPDAAAFAAAHRRLEAAGVPVRTVDHGISWAIYLTDPDGIGLEIFLDRRAAPGGRSRWSGTTRPLSADEIAALGD